MKRPPCSAARRRWSGGHRPRPSRAALGVPTVGIYTATDPGLTGLYAGRSAVNLGNIGHAPDAAAVIDALQQAAVC